MPKLEKQRDEQGWLIPREGTRNRAIYERLRAEEPFAWICAAFPQIKSKHVAAIIWKIKNPERRNQVQRRRTERPRESVEEVGRKVVLYLGKRLHLPEVVDEARQAIQFFLHMRNAAAVLHGEPLLELRKKCPENG